MKKNNKGYTLVEMIVVIAIISIFTATIFGIISTASSMMKRTSGNTTVQMSLQKVADSIENLILKANKNIYSAYGNSQRVTAPIEGDTSRKEEKSLYVTYSEGTQETDIWLDTITWNPNTKKLTYEHISNNKSSVTQKEELATGVSWFHIDTSHVEEDGTVYFQITIEKNGVDISLSQSVYVRNKVTVENPF